MARMPSPGSVGGGVATEENRADAGHVVALGAACDDRFAVGIEELVSLALVDGIIAKGGHATLGDEDWGSLVKVAGLAVGTVAAGDKDTGEGRFAFGQVEDGGNEVFGLAFEDDFFNSVAVALFAAGDLGVEWCSFGEPTELFDEEVSHLLLVGGDLFGCFEFLEFGLAAVQGLVDFFHEVGVEHFAGSDAFRLLGEDGKVIRRLGGWRRCCDKWPEEKD